MFTSIFWYRYTLVVILPSSDDLTKTHLNTKVNSKEKEHSITNIEEENNDEKVPEAVRCRSRKPGELVFAAARKEDDGTRKNLPMTAPKARSKSKKQIAEMIENLPKKDAESLFDFHGQ